MRRRLARVESVSACGSRKDPKMPTNEATQQLNRPAEMLAAAPDGLGVDENTQLGNVDEGAAEDSAGEDAGNAAGNGQ